MRDAMLPPSPPIARPASGPAVEPPGVVVLDPRGVEPTPVARPRTVPQDLRLRTAVLAGIVLLAAALRFIGLGWDQGHMLHPDERFVTMVTGAVQFPANPLDYFNTETSTLNPYNRGFGSFAYGTAPLFFIRAVADFTGFKDLMTLGRAMSGLADIGSILMLFLIGCRLLNWRVAALGAFLVAVTPMHIQQAHFYTMDSVLVFLLMVAVYYAVRVAQEGSTLDYALLGVFYGLSTASKISAATFGLVVVAACAVRAWHNWDARRPRRQVVWSGNGTAAAGAGARVSEVLAAVETPIAGCVLALLLAAIVFRIGQPYAFQGPHIWNVGLNPKYVADMSGWSKISSGEVDQPPSVQWANRTPYVYALEQMLRWGMGVPLGIASWIGVALATVVLLRGLGTRQGRARWLVLLVPLVWIGFNWYYWGKAFANAMRYFLPIYPLLILLASWALLGFLAWARRFVTVRATGGEATGATGAGRDPWARLRPWLPRLAMAALFVVVGYTTLYGLAYMSIYLHPTTRVAASEWIMTNLPPGTRVANEHWDDPVPLRVLGRDSAPWAGPQLELYAEEEPSKRDRLLAALDQADVIAITSSRLTSSIPRIPERYPLAVEYYRLLFNGELGFEKIAEFTSYPSLGPWRFMRDDDAQELWLNYDHPKVMLFRKTPAYSPQRARELLGRVNLDQVVKGLRTSQAYTHGLLMTPEMRAAQEEGGTWSQIVDRHSPLNAFPAQAWWLVVVLLGLVTYPLMWAVFGRLADRGYAVSKIVAIALLSWGAWFLASLRLLPYSRESVLLVLALIAVGSGLVLWRRGAAFFRDVRERAELLLFVEAVFAATYVFFLAVRMANPDLWHGNFGGEKPMDFAYLNAVLKSTYFPPYDPWLAGGYINYYYFGQVLVATLIRLTGIVPAVAYNLAIALFFALLASACFSFVFSLIAGPRARTSPRVVTWATAGGLLAVAFVALFGNLDGLLQVLDRVAGRIPAQQAFDFWRSTRVIGPEEPQPITEFPYFTFLYGDLHAHLLALPLALLALHVALALARGAGLVPVWALLRGQPWPPAAAAVTRPRPFAHLRRERSAVAPLDRAAAAELAGEHDWAARGELAGGERPAPAEMEPAGEVAPADRNGDEPATFFDEHGAPSHSPTSTAQPLWAADAHARWHAEPASKPYEPAPAEAPASERPVAAPTWPMAAPATASAAGLRATAAPADAEVLSATGDPSPSGAVEANGHTPDNGHATANAHAAEPSAAASAPLRLASPRAREGVVEAYLPWRPRPLQAVRVADLAAPAAPPLPWGLRLRALLGQDVVWLILLGGLVDGLLRMTNTWDFPTYLVLLAAAGAVAEYRTRGITAGGIVRAGLLAAGLFVVMSIAVQPYMKSFALFYTGVERLAVHTSLNHYLTIHGFFLFAIGSLLAYQLWLVRGRLLPRAAAAPLARQMAPVQGFWDPPTGSGSALAAWLQPSALVTVAAAALLLAVVVLVLAKHVVPALVLVGLAAIAALVPWHRQRADRLLLLGMVALALALTAVVEFVALRGDVGRMNTVFKFYLQVWVMLGLAAAVAVIWLLRRWRASATAWRVWGAALLGLAAACLIYPVQATPVKTGLRFANLPPTLDGMAYMQAATYHDRGQPIPLAADYDAIRWLQDNVPGSPTILEAQVPEYKWGSRVSIYTGLPAVVGWNWHQRQQRGDFSWMVTERVADVQKMYETTSADELRRLLAKYGVEYVYVGPYERAYYPEAGLRKFGTLTGTLFDLVYDSGPAGVQIYRVRGRG